MIITLILVSHRAVGDDHSCSLTKSLAGTFPDGNSNTAMYSTHPNFPMNATRAPSYVSPSNRNATRVLLFHLLGDGGGRLRDPT